MNAIPFSVVPGAEGFQWLRESIRIFRSQWLRYTSIAALFLLIMQVASLISGGILVVFLKPVLSVGFLAAAWHHERGELPEARHLFAGFKSNVKALLPLGAAAVVARRNSSRWCSRWRRTGPTTPLSRACRYCRIESAATCGNRISLPP